VRVLLITFGSAGDVHPMIALGRALQDRGVRVTLVTNGYFQRIAQDAGLGFTALGKADEYLNTIQNPALWHHRKGFEVVARAGILPAIRPVYDLIAQYDPQETILVASSLIFGARIAQEKLGFRLISVHLQPSMFRSVYETPVMPGMIGVSKMPVFAKRWMYRAVDAFALDPVLGPETNAFRRELGLSPVKSLFGAWIHSPDRVVGLFPDWFAPPQSDWPAQTVLPGFVRFDRAELENEIPATVEAFLESGDPPVVFTPGTAMQHGSAFFAVAVDACKLLGRRGLLLTQHNEHLPTALPDSVRHVSYLPFSRTLQRVAALVHHGGIGTCAQGLAAGIPQLVMPMAHDQPDNAHRLKRLGVGDFLLPGAFRGKAVAARLDRLLGTLEVTQACRAFAAKTDFAEAAQRVCKVVEEHAPVKPV